MYGNRSGNGTGKTVGEFTLTSWNLSAGKEGRYSRQKYKKFGGGGGGILVNGVEPTHYLNHNQFQGEGYGGGGSGARERMVNPKNNTYYFLENHRGLSGVILLEVDGTQQSSV